MKFQTKLKDCNCDNGGIIIYEGVAVCRWCRTPYANGGYINYEPEHFQKESKHILKDKDFEILEYGYCQHNDGTPDTQYPYKVKRLSDGEVFSISDINMGRKIERFFEGWNGMEVHFTNNSATLLAAMMPNSYKPKVPLFSHKNILTCKCGCFVFTLDKKCVMCGEPFN